MKSVRLYQDLLKIMFQVLTVSPLVSINQILVSSLRYSLTYSIILVKQKSILSPQNSKNSKQIYICREEQIKVLVSEIVGSQQTAHLANRSIRTTLLKMRKIVYEIDDKTCIVTIDFSKAFDRINRSFLMQVLDKQSTSKTLPKN